MQLARMTSRALFSLLVKMLRPTPAPPAVARAMPIGNKIAQLYPVSNRVVEATCQISAPSAQPVSMALDKLYFFTEAQIPSNQFYIFLHLRCS